MFPLSSARKHMPSCLKCGSYFPNWAKINGTTRNLCNRKSCLVCSPFGQHNTKKLIQGQDPAKRRCPACEQTLALTEFYVRRGAIGHSVYCKPCTNKQTIER